MRERRRGRRLHRAKRNPGTFMMRLRVHNGIVTSEQMNFYADTVEPYGPDVGVIDITTRQNIQLRAPPAPAPAKHAESPTSPLATAHRRGQRRGGALTPAAPRPRAGGVTLADGPGVIDGLHALNQTCIQTGFDNIRNMVGNPVRAAARPPRATPRPWFGAAPVALSAALSVPPPPPAWRSSRASTSTRWWTRAPSAIC